MAHQLNPAGFYCCPFTDTCITVCDTYFKIEQHIIFKHTLVWLADIMNIVVPVPLNALC